MNLLRRTPPRLLTLIVAALGTLAFTLLGLPLPFLFGPMAACLITALLGAPLKGLGQISVGARTILGVAVGASITPALLHQVPLMAGSVALIPVYILLIALIGVPFFNRLFGFDPVTSFYAAMPGGLQDMVIFGQAAGGNVRALSGEVELEVEFGNTDVVVRVADSGQGIPDEQRERVFDRFFRMSDDASGGCGLGLAIVRQVAEAHGGSARVAESSIGGAVEVHFPIARKTTRAGQATS